MIMQSISYFIFTENILYDYYLKDKFNSVAE